MVSGGSVAGGADVVVVVVEETVVVVVEEIVEVEETGVVGVVVVHAGLDPCWLVDLSSVLVTGGRIVDFVPDCSPPEEPHAATRIVIASPTATPRPRLTRRGSVRRVLRSGRASTVSHPPMASTSHPARSSADRPVDRPITVRTMRQLSLCHRGDAVRAPDD